MIEHRKTPDEVLKLIERFARNREAYLSGQYNETQLRREFIDPFFEALGWDVNNRQGYAEAYKDVIHEDTIKIGSATKAPDYCFRIGGTRKFFVETKKPSVNIKDDLNPAFQLRRYAWSAKLPLSILTDFEEFAVYDCRIAPAKTDKASTARIMYLTYEDFSEKWTEIEPIFSREAILKGSFDKYAEKGKHKRGTAEVDDAFLKEIESWRDILAKNIALRNPELSQRELNFSVQRTIDRIIFLRICEDRGIEQYGRLMTLMNGANIYRRLLEFFRTADEKYNSGLFHFNKEKDRHEMPDELTPILAIDDKHLKDIIKRLYYPESPYEFSVLPANILGQVYEQFLGKVIRLTAGHRAIVEEKPEVRKAGGVYYTPTYIVDYIVKNTVGRLVPRACPDDGSNVGADLCVCPNDVYKQTNTERQKQGAHVGAPLHHTITPKDISKIRILDPACGSGSFLLGAYQYLLDWHRDHYANNDPQKLATGKNPVLYQAQGGDWHLTTSEKKRILLNNIYGVDIDSQAVEVTKLSLLLKVLEGENNQTIEKQLKFYHERALPDLGDNIKCGNSLIGPDFYHNDLFVGADLCVCPDSRHSQEKGRTHRCAPTSDSKTKKTEQKQVLDDEERYRINVFDWEKEFPHVFLPSPRAGEGKGEGGGFDAVIGNPPYGATLPESTIIYLKNKSSTYVLRGESYLVFIEKAITLLKKAGQFGYIVPDTYLNLGFTQSLRDYLLQNTRLREIVSLPSKVFTAATVDTTLLFAEKAERSHAYHKHDVLVKSFNKKKIISSVSHPDRIFSISTEIWHKQKAFNISSDNTEALLINKIENFNKKIEDVAGMFSGIKVYEVGKGSPPQTEHIRDTKPYTLDKKGNKEFQPFYDGKHIGRYALLWNQNNWVKYGPWLAAPRNPENFVDGKILIRKIVGETLIATYIPETSYCNTLLHVLKIKPHANLQYQFLLGILNSKFIGWYYRKKFQISADDTFPQIMIRDIIQFPLPDADQARHDKMVSMVEQMLSLNKQLTTAKTDHEKTSLQRQIEATDKQIDKLVYELYGLTEEEIRIVEGQLKLIL